MLTDLQQQVDKKLLLSVRDTIRQGFSWAAREGPLCEERKLSPSPTRPIILFSRSFMLVHASHGKRYGNLRFQAQRPKLATVIFVGHFYD
jgi:hypothetical protein